MLKSAVKQKPVPPTIAFYVGSNVPCSMRLESIPEDSAPQNLQKYDPNVNRESTVTFFEPLVTHVHSDERYSQKEHPYHLLYYAIPQMPLPLAVVLCVFNLFLPGLGSLCASFTCFCCGTTRVGKPLKGFALNLLSALLQMLTFLIIVGWIWSILWGMTFVQLSLSAKRSHGGSPLPYYVRRQSSVE